MCTMRASLNSTMDIIFNAINTGKIKELKAKLCQVSISSYFA